MVKSSLPDGFPKKIWCAVINTGGGLLTLKPRRMTWNACLQSWWDRMGDLDVQRLGFDDRESYITYASEDKKEVELFILGARSFINTCLKRYVP